MTRRNVLFVCGQNRWRSPTAERVYQNDVRLSVRSCGLSPKSPRRLGAKELEWAELVLVMEAQHAARIRKHFRAELGKTPLRVLEIPDDYQFMDAELVELLSERVESVLTEFELE